MVVKIFVESSSPNIENQCETIVNIVLLLYSGKLSIRLKTKEQQICFRNLVVMLCKFLWLKYNDPSNIFERRGVEHEVLPSDIVVCKIMSYFEKTKQIWLKLPNIEEIAILFWKLSFKMET